MNAGSVLRQWKLITHVIQTDVCQWDQRSHGLGVGSPHSCALTIFTRLPCSQLRTLCMRWLPLGSRCTDWALWSSRYSSSTSRSLQCTCSSHVESPRFQLNSISVPQLPSSLISLTATPVSTSNLFHKASDSVDALDELDLYIWECDPPYDYPEPDRTANEVCHTKNMVDVMFGCRWRLSKMARDEHALWIVDGNARELLVEMVTDLAGHIHRWIDVASKVAEMEEDGRNRVMADCWLCWQVRDILADTGEATVLSSGENPYIVPT